MTRNPAKGVAGADLNEARKSVYLSPEDLAMLAERIDPHYSLFIRFLSGTGLVLGSNGAPPAGHPNPGRTRRRGRQPGMEV